MQAWRFLHHSIMDNKEAFDGATAEEIAKHYAYITGYGPAEPEMDPKSLMELKITDDQVCLLIDQEVLDLFSAHELEAEPRPLEVKIVESAWEEEEEEAVEDGLYKVAGRGSKPRICTLCMRLWVVGRRWRRFGACSVRV